MVSKKILNKIVGSIGDGLATEIFARSQDNLSSREFAEREISSGEYPDTKGNKDKPEKKFTITNTAMLARSGYKKGDKRKLQWVVGYQAPHASDVNYGTPARNIPFGNLYQWAFQRKKEIREYYGDLKPPSRGKDPKFWKMYYKYSKSTKQGMKKKIMVGKVPGQVYKGSGRGRNKQYEKVDQSRATYLYVFTFAYYVWLGIKKKGIEPSFFFSDAVHTTMNDKTAIIRRALQNTEGIEVVS